jgi:hypothetical protein
MQLSEPHKAQRLLGYTDTMHRGFYLARILPIFGSTWEFLTDLIHRTMSTATHGFGIMGNID